MNRCHSTLGDIKRGEYSRAALRALADGKAFPARVDFTRESVIQFRRREAQRISISGVQDKVSLILRRGKLTPVIQGGHYILKPIPRNQGLEFEDDVPANEHLTMQIAEQVFGLSCAANCCVQMADDELGYVTRRFDYETDRKIAQEDFCQLSNRTEETAGRNYKYDGSYEEVGAILKHYCKIWKLESKRLYAQILACYTLSNGDAHLKNFSLVQTRDGDYRLSPAYDMLCTSLHLPNESRLALDLFADTFESDAFRANGFYCGSDFVELGHRLELDEKTIETTLLAVQERTRDVEELIDRSFLSSAARADYLFRFRDRLKALSVL